MREISGLLAMTGMMNGDPSSMNGGISSSHVFYKRVLVVYETGCGSSWVLQHYFRGLYTVRQISMMFLYIF